MTTRSGRLVGRRWFLSQTGRGAVGIAVLGLAACSGSSRSADTGVGGSADEIGAVLDKAGPGWAGVRHVALTHKHPDHVGSIGDVLTSATRATAYAGAADLAAVEAPRPLKTLGDGEEVFGLQVVETPGRTAGHLAVYDADPGSSSQATP